MLKMSGKTRLVARLLSKLFMSLAIGSITILSLMFIKYKFVYAVEVNNEDVGYVASKLALEKRIDDYLVNGESENVGYVISNSRLKYELMLVEKNIETKDEEVFAMVKENSDVYYKVYAVLVDGKEKGLVGSLEEAQHILDSVNEKQADYINKSTVELEEKYLQEYDLLADVEVAINEIYEPIKKANTVVEIKTTPAASKTVSDDVLYALRDNLTSLNFNVPVTNYIVSSRFGWRSSGYHYGLDLAAPTGTEIRAAESGVVTYADWLGAYGYLIRIKHNDEYETYYGHCSKILVNVGDTVEKGDLIGKVGSTGRSSGPHVHVEVRYQGTPLNPEVFLYND